jgi:broad specificity phosphatase PhoE
LALPALEFFFGNGDGKKDDDDDKRVVFLRHGTTEMNEYLHTQCSYYSPDFKDPLLFDTRLTADGAERARRVAAKAAAALSPRPELVVASPLTRALQTAELAFGPLLDAGVPCLALPLARERLFLSSDVGRNPAALADEFPRWRESLLAMEDEWWLEGGEAAAAAEEEEQQAGEEGARRRGCAAASTSTTTTTTTALRRSRRHLRTPTPRPNPSVDEEGDGAFAARMDALGAWLRGRPERCVAVVSHWGPILEATGVEFENVEMRSFRLSQLRL